MPERSGRHREWSHHIHEQLRVDLERPVRGSRRSQIVAPHPQHLGVGRQTFGVATRTRRRSNSINAFGVAEVATYSASRCSTFGWVDHHPLTVCSAASGPLLQNLEQHSQVRDTGTRLRAVKRPNAAQAWRSRSLRSAARLDITARWAPRASKISSNRTGAVRM